MTPKVLFISISTLLFIGVGIFFMINTRNTQTGGAAEVTTPVNEKNIVLAAFGDSLTAGYGVTLEESYPSLLEARLKEEGINVTILNMGVSGETSAAGKDRTGFVLDQKPDIILLGLGANDMLRSLPVASTRENLEKIIQDLQGSGVKIVLLGMKSTVTNGLSYKREFDQIYEDLAKKYSLPLVPFFLEDVALVSELNTSDGIHPNKAGYQLIVDDNIIPVLLPFIKKNF